MANSQITVEVIAGPVLRTALDVLDLAAELVNELPEWENPQYEELRQRTIGLRDRVVKELKCSL